jgi:hypothetical protein
MLDRDALSYANELSWRAEQLDGHFPDWRVLVFNEYGTRVWFSAWSFQAQAEELIMLLDGIKNSSENAGYEMGRMATE